MSDQKAVKVPKPKYTLRFSENPDSELATGWLPLGIGEQLWRAKPGTSIVLYVDPEDPGGMARMVNAYAFRLRNESGLDFRVSTKVALMTWTDFEAPEGEERKPGQRVTNIPRDSVARMLIVTVLSNPMYEKYLERIAAGLEAPEGEGGEGEKPKRGRGRPAKPKEETTKRPRGRPRKGQAAEADQLPLEPAE